MKKIYLLPFFLMGFQVTIAQLFLTEPLAVSTEGTGTRAPRIALLEGNRPVVYWGKTGSNPTLYMAIWADGNFNEPVALNTNGIEPDLWGGGLGPHIAAQDNLIFLVFENYGEGIYCIKSDDGGTSFSDPVTVYTPPAGRTATLPTIAIDPAGNPVISFVTTNFSEEEALYEITKSADGGLSFPPTTVANVAASGTEVCECCPATLAAISDEEVYLGFRNNNENLRDIWVAKSLDDGNNFSIATDIDETDWTIQACPQSGPDMLVSGDNIFATFYSGTSGANIYFSSLNKETMEAGEHFQIPSIGGPDQNQNYPAIAGSGDTLAVIWQESATFGLDIMMSWTSNGSTDLLANSMVIEDANLSQRQPDMVFANGLFHIVYEDQLLGRVIYRIASFEEIVSANNLIKRHITASIQPNPFYQKTILNIDNSNGNNIDLTIIDVNGQIIQKMQGNRNQFEVELLNSGVYFATIQNGKQRIIKKIIAQ